MRQAAYRTARVGGLSYLLSHVRALATYRGERERTAAALRRATSLERVARDLAATTEPDAVLRSIPHSALSVVDADYAAIVLRRGDEFEVAAGAGLAERVVGMRRSSGDGVFGDVLKSRAYVVCEDYGTSPAAVASVVDLGIRTLLGMPMFVSGEMAACLTVGRVASRPFDSAEIATVEGLAAHASIALRNARHLEQALRLDDLARAAMDGRRPEDVLQGVVDGARTAFGVDLTLVARITDNELEIVAASGAAARMRGVRGPLGPVLQDAVRTGEIVAIDDYATARAMRDDGPSTLFFDEVGGHAAVLAPIRDDGRVIAVLIVGSTDPYRTFDRLDRQAIAAFAESTRAALQAARGRREREEHIARLTALNDLAIRLALVHEPGAIARLAWEAASKLVPHDAFYVAQYDDERQMFDFIFHEDQGSIDPERLSLPLGDGPSSRAVRTGEPYVVGPGSEAVARGKTFGDEGRRSASAVHVPLRIGKRVVGVLSAQSYTAGVYDAEHVAVLGSLANLVASSFENASLIGRTRELYLASVRALASAVDARDPYTRSHSARVAALARTLAEEMSLSPDEMRRVQIGALLHDIGKIGIPDAILNKPGPLTDEEWVIMRTHPALGGSIVSSVEPLAELAPVIRCHHERYDGAGYPDRLAGDAVPLASYVVAAADAYEVIVSRRSYKEAATLDQAVAEMRRCRGTQFHPAVVDAFLRIVERDRTEGTQHLSRVSAIEHEEIENVPGPGDVLERLAGSTRTHARQLAILQRIAGEITSVLDLDELADRLLRIVCEAMGYDSGFLLTLDDDGATLKVRAGVGPSAEYIGQDLGRDQGISWWVMEHGRLQNVADVRADARYVGPHGIRSTLVVPLRIGEERIGVMGIESTRLKAFHSEDEALLTAVSHQVAAAVRVARLHRAAEQAASTDALTGLPNRRVFFQRLEAALRTAQVEGTPLTVALVDVDLLKQVNDQLGHGIGDEALQGVARILGAGVREQDVAARLGGDEFGVLFCGAPILVAERIMRRLAETVRSTALVGKVPLPAISWGLAEATGAAGVDALIDAADGAMYRHKRRARVKALAE